jgi:KaiC/GvpD/RAD55 family RecA-like ATPase
LKDWERDDAELLKEAAPEGEKKRLHVDDDTSVIVSYNDEKSFIDHWRTRAIPSARIFEWCMLHSAVTGTLSENFYRQFESLCDGIIDFKSIEENERVEHYARIRTMRGKAQDSRWRRLRLLDTGEVTFDRLPPKAGEIGITAWLKGPKKR